MCLQLLGRDVSDSISRVGCWLERQEVSEETTNVRRSHRGARDGVGGVFAADPGRLNVETGGEDVGALSIVGEVGTLIAKCGSTDSDGLYSSSGRVVAGICVVVSSSDSEVNTGINSSIDSKIESWGFATAQAHVGDGALVTLLLAGLDSTHNFDMIGSGPLDTLDDIRHATTAVASKNLDSLDMSLLSNTKLLACNGSRAMCSVSITVFIGIAAWNGLPPAGSSLKVNMANVGTSVDHVCGHTLTTIGRIEVLRTN